MTKDQKKQALAMHVANLSPEAIARALELPIEDVHHALKIEPAEPAAAPIAQTAPEPAPEGPQHVRIGKTDAYARVFGNGGATLHMPSRRMDQSSEKRRI